jgi:Sel1 repeat
MITDLINVEPLLGQHDPGVILVGPLLSLSMNSSYRYFYIAGKGSKVYETISLGFEEVEAVAQARRADFIEKLNSRFAEVLTFVSHLEMARAVHMRWPNEETTKFLALAELEAKPKPTKVAARQDTIDDDRQYAGVVSGGYGKQLVDKAPAMPVDHGRVMDAISTNAPPLALGQVLPMPASRLTQRLMASRSPKATLSQPRGSDQAVTEQQRHSKLSQDDIAAAILRLKSPTELKTVPKQPVETARHSTPIIMGSIAIGLVAALVAFAWVVVLPSIRQVADQTASAPVAAPSISVSRNKEPSSVTATVPSSIPKQLTKASEPALKAERAPAGMPPSPPSQSLQVASVPATPAPGPPLLPAQASSTATRVDPSLAAAAVVPNQSTGANEPGAQSDRAPAAMPPSPPSQPSQVASIQAAATPAPGPQSLPTQADNPRLDPSPAGAAVPPSALNQQPTATNVPVTQSDRAPAAMPPSAQPSQVASAPAAATPAPGPRSPPAQGASTARRLDAEEIATLVNRGTDAIKSGDVASARLLLRRAAEAGNANAALTLGTTFDPLVIRELGTIGVVPDVAQARRWYEKAAALGSSAASQRLEKLSQIRP